MAMIDNYTGAKAESNLAHQGAPRMQPGGLRSETTMTLQTRQAQKLVEGRKRVKGIEPIIGLLEFGRRLKQIWLSAEANDPYADWYLVQVEEELHQVRQLISGKTAWLNGVMAGMEGFDIQVAESLQPIQVSIYFQNPYGYMGAYLVSDFDVLARTVFTARHVGLLDRLATEQLMNETGSAIRRVFYRSSGWKFTGVTRDDLARNNPLAQRALETMGECPQDIIAALKRAKLAPPLKKRPVVVTAESLMDVKFEAGAVTPVSAFG